MSMQFQTEPKSTPQPSFAPVRANLPQRKCACGGTPGLDGECAAWRKKRLAPQRHASNYVEPDSVPSSVHEILRSPGRPLDPATRTVMEPHFGHDFSQVRVHTDAKAAQSAHEIDGLAYTVGQDIAFGTGQYSPGEPTGSRLLAHELSHVVQQTGGSQQGLTVGEPDSRYEQEAERAAEILSQPASGTESASTLPPVQSRIGNSLIQRQPPPQATTPGPVQAPTLAKSSAQDGLLRWQSKALEFIEGTRAWLSNNWDAYLGFTSQNPRLGWQEGFTYTMVSNAFGNALGEVGNKLLTTTIKRGAVKASVGALGAAVGTAVAPGVGTAIGFAVGVLIESIAGAIFDWITGKAEVDEAAAQASRRTAQLSEAKSIKFDQQAKAATVEVQRIFAQRQTSLTATTSQGTVDDINRQVADEIALIKNPPPSDDRSLYKMMIHDWVLEHAGDEEEANKATSEAQWQGALSAAKDPTGVNRERKAMGLPALPQTLPKGEDLDNHPEIFAYQTRGHWLGAGLPGFAAASEMIEKVKQIQGEARDPAQAVMGYFDDKRFEFHSTTSSQLLIRFLKQELPSLLPLSEEGKFCIEKNQFILTCTLDLSSGDGSVYVNEWEYTLTFTCELPLLQIGKASFDVSPD